MTTEQTITITLSRADASYLTRELDTAILTHEKTRGPASMIERTKRIQQQIIDLLESNSPPPPRPICHGYITRDNISYIFEIYSAHDGSPEDFAIYTERQDGSKGQSVDPDPFLTDVQLAYQAHIENESLRE